MLPRIGMMLKNIKLTGTSLSLEEGQLVKLTPATNIPNGEGRYYAEPLDDSDNSNSILLDTEDVEVY